MLKHGHDCFLMFEALIASVLKKLGETNLGEVLFGFKFGACISTVIGGGCFFCLNCFGF